jgi:putative transposase
MSSDSSNPTRPPVGSTSAGPYSVPHAPHAPHLTRLSRVWIDRPIYFITTCTQNRVLVLASDSIHEILRAEWLSAETRHGWQIGRYIIMPDHVHFFCTPLPEAKPLADFMQRWKEWTAKRILAAVKRPAPLW